MDQRVTSDCVANARALAPMLAAAAARIEAARELPPDIVDALHQARLFRMLVPCSCGGDEVSPVAFMQAIEELAKANADGRLAPELTACRFRLAARHDERMKDWRAWTFRGYRLMRFLDRPQSPLATDPHWSLGWSAIKFFES